MSDTKFAFCCVGIIIAWVALMFGMMTYFHTL